jgi:hypothetical protein
MANDKVEIAHGGECPPGYIYNHDKNTADYGKCVSVFAYKEDKALKGLEWMKNNESRRV